MVLDRIGRETGTVTPVSHRMGKLLSALYYVELVNFFARSLHSRDAAQDVVQEAYARVLALQHNGKAVQNLRALLYRIGKNVLIDGARHRESEARMLESLSVLKASHAPSAEQQIEARQQIECFVRRLEAMPRKRREAFVWVRIYGCSYAEAAQHMGLSREAVDQHLVRAVMDLARDGSPWR